MSEKGKSSPTRTAFLIFEISAVCIAVAIVMAPLVNIMKKRVGTWPLQSGGSPDTARIIDGPISKQDTRLFGLPGPERLGLLGRNGMRVMIRPSFGDFCYDVYLALSGLDIPSKNKVLVRVIARHGGNREYQFDIPDEDLMMMMRAYDHRAENWSGEKGMTLDGTGVFVERIGEGRIRSMYTNSDPAESPSNPAAQLRSDLLRMMLAYGPTGVFPRNYDWHVIAEEHGTRPCQGLDLNFSDPDGFGTGDDDCARWKTRIKS